MPLRIAIIWAALASTAAQAAPPLRRPSFDADFALITGGRSYSGRVAVSGSRIRIDEGGKAFIASIDEQTCSVVRARSFDPRTHTFREEALPDWLDGPALVSWLDSDCISPPLQDKGVEVLNGRKVAVVTNADATWWKDPLLSVVARFERGRDVMLELSAIRIRSRPPGFWSPQRFEESPEDLCKRRGDDWAYDARTRRCRWNDPDGLWPTSLKEVQTVRSPGELKEALAGVEAECVRSGLPREYVDGVTTGLLNWELGRLPRGPVTLRPALLCGWIQRFCYYKPVDRRTCEQDLKTNLGEKDWNASLFASQVQVSRRSGCRYDRAWWLAAKIGKSCAELNSLLPAQLDELEEQWRQEQAARRAAEEKALARQREAERISRAQALDQKAAADCRKRGGIYRKLGLASPPECVERTIDAGWPCLDGLQCQGRICVAPAAAGFGSFAMGTCVEDKAGGLGACIAEVRFGIVGGALCVD